MLLGATYVSTKRLMAGGVSGVFAERRHRPLNNPTWSHSPQVRGTCASTDHWLWIGFEGVRRRWTLFRWSNSNQYILACSSGTPSDGKHMHAYTFPGCPPDGWSRRLGKGLRGTIMGRICMEVHESK